MRFYILFLLSFFSMASMASEPDLSFYAGAGATHRTIDEQDGNGEVIYLGFSLSDKVLPIVSQVELQLEQYSISIVDVDQAGLHVQGSLFATKRHQVYLDVGANYAEYTVAGITADKAFPSAGLGYRFAAGPVVFRVSYEVEHIGEVEGIDIGNAEKASASLVWSF